VKILFLHGWHFVPGGLKPTYLKDRGYVVINPTLDDDDFYAAAATGQAKYDRHQPDVIVGTSRGGAVALNIVTVDTTLVLLGPAWKIWDTLKTLKSNSLILHSCQDDFIPFEDFEELVLISGLSCELLIEIVIPPDATQGSSQTYGEDCPVCCRTITILVRIEDPGRISFGQTPNSNTTDHRRQGTGKRGRNRLRPI